MESLSDYARQFLGQMQKPRVDHVSGLSPAISIEQKTTSRSPRSTVGTVTEVYDYLRILYARLGQPYCPACSIPVGTQTADEIIGKILALPEGTKLYLMAPLERKGQERYETLFDEVRRSGFVRRRAGGGARGARGGRARGGAPGPRAGPRGGAPAPRAPPGPGPARPCRPRGPAPATAASRWTRRSTS